MPVSASLPDSVSVSPAIDLRLELVAMRAGVGLIGSYFAAGEMNNKNSHKTNQIKACSKYWNTFVKMEDVLRQYPIEALSPVAAGRMPPPRSTQPWLSSPRSLGPLLLRLVGKHPSGARQQTNN